MNAPTPAGAELRAEGQSVSHPAHRPRHGRYRWAGALTLIVLFAIGAWWGYQSWLGREWHLAQAAIARHDLDQAAAHLDRHLARRPGDTAGWFLAGRTARRRLCYDEAERHLVRCQQLGGVTDATRLEWDLLRVQQGQLGEIAARLKRTIPPEHPDAPLVLEALARGYRHTDRLREVLEACDLWISRQPDHPWPWLWRGEVFEMLQNYNEALSAFQRAAENAPNDREVRLALGNLLLRGREPGAAEQFQLILDRKPDDAEASIGLAACRLEQGKPDEAVALLEPVLNADPNAARGLLLRGRAALELRDPAGAEQWLSRAVKAAPDDSESLHLLTLALRGQGKHKEADPLQPRLEALRQDGVRLNALARAVARTPDEVGPRHEAGVICLRIGRTQQGLRWLFSALNARGDHRPTHAALAEHFRRTEDPRAEHHRRLAEAPP